VPSAFPHKNILPGCRGIHWHKSVLHHSLLGPQACGFRRLSRGTAAIAVVAQRGWAARVCDTRLLPDTKFRGLVYLVKSSPKMAGRRGREIPFRRLLHECGAILRSTCGPVGACQP